MTHNQRLALESRWRVFIAVCHNVEVKEADKLIDALDKHIRDAQDRDADR